MEKIQIGDIWTNNTVDAGFRIRGIVGGDYVVDIWMNGQGGLEPVTINRQLLEGYLAEGFNVRHVSPPEKDKNED